MCVVYVREDNDSQFIGHDYTIFIDLGVWERPLNLISPLQ